MQFVKIGKHFLYKFVIGETRDGMNGFYVYILANSVHDAVNILKQKCPHTVDCFKRVEEVRDWEEKERIFATEVIRNASHQGTV